MARTICFSKNRKTILSYMKNDIQTLDGARPLIRLIYEPHPNSPYIKLWLRHCFKKKIDYCLNWEDI